MKRNDNGGSRPYLTDSEITELYFSRNERAISETHRKFGNYLFKIAHNYLSDAQDAEECVNDTYATAWNKIPPEHPDSLPAFLSKITVNISLDRYKAKTRQKRAAPTLSLDELDGVITETEPIEDEYLRGELRRTINDFVKNLSEREQTIFVCRYYCADKVAYIAKMLGVSESTVTKELKKIKEKLKAALTNSGYTF